MRQRKPPVKLPKFMEWVHANIGGNCCLCELRDWTALHHFGDDGGGSMRPSDTEIARVCEPCHRKNDYKRRALVKENKTDVLERYQRDALYLLREWLRSEKGK